MDPVKPEEVVNGFGSKLKVLLEELRQHVDPHDYEEILNHAEALLATVATVVFFSYGYEDFGISVDRETMEVEVTVENPATY